MSLYLDICDLGCWSFTLSDVHQAVDNMDLKFRKKFRPEKVGTHIMKVVVENVVVDKITKGENIK